MKIFHLVKVRFSRSRADIDEMWLKRRCQLFQETCLRSLTGQIFKDFVLWINCDDTTTLGMLTKPLTTDLRCVWSTGDAPPERARFAEDLWQQLIASDYVYITRIDSDDLFSPQAMQLVNESRPQIARVEGLLFRQGYLYDMAAGRLGVYHNPSPPFHTIMMPTATFLDPAAYAQVWHRVGDHSLVSSALPCQVLPSWQFTVLLHGSNFLSTFDYCSRPEIPVPKTWTLNGFLKQPVVFDVDDFCDAYCDETLECLDALNERYPLFKATLFTIPAKTTQRTLALCRGRPWLELAVHGITHEPNLELKTDDGGKSPASIGFGLESLHNSVNGSCYVKGFRPPGWYITGQHIHVLNKLGYWVALHARDEKALGQFCINGYYICGDRLPYSHHHAHNVCGNYLKTDLPALLDRWTSPPEFSWVSEQVLIPQSVWANSRKDNSQ